MALLVGIDVGTTRVKTLIFDLQGNIVGQAGETCPLALPREGWVEHDPRAMWRAVVKTARAALSQAPAGERVLGISLSTQAGTTIPVDAKGQPLRNGISWMDRRGQMCADELRRVLDPQEVYHASGWPNLGGSVLADIAWLRHHEPAVYQATRHFMQVHDYVVQCLTGTRWQDYSNAGYSQLFNILETKWNEQALEAVGITPEQLPKVGPSGQAIAPLSAEAAYELGLSTDTWVMTGAHDQYAAALGAGVVEPGQVLLSCGTAWVLLVTTAEPVWGSGARAMAVSRHAAPGRWGAMRSLGGVGTTVEWYVDTILAPLGGYAEGQRGGAFQVMNDELGGVPVGARGLLCFPMVGGRTGLYTQGRSCLWGLTNSHHKHDIGRALLEGVAFELRSSIEEIRTAQMPIRSVVMVGGAARSSCWPQIIADVLDLQVTVPAVQEAGARGAAIMAGMGLGLFSAEIAFHQQRRSNRIFDPQPAASQDYDALFSRYQSAFRAFSEWFTAEG